ncbi:MAG: tRNA uridine-5-carboxymethylaminomethyl(34) synthesis enzyme MnmG [Cytophagales bacterium]|jgi:tRNA uridine 5-carboxymethylaminomethyl modification enzyme|nr:tRNA uridine-5-carboxymethylaminomethyl(34) synthesis enzyme MnmG [Cytophagales bacterium]
MFEKYDIIVIGGGHAGCEAAACAATLGSKVLLITSNLKMLAHMSCNPSIGGIAKGQIVREIDALGGFSGMVTDISSVQFRMLNKSKGPAMWSPRAQCNRNLFSKTWRQILENIPNVDFWQDTVNEILVKNNTTIGVKTQMQISFSSTSVIITSGTFLNGKIFIGNKIFSAGRIGEFSALGLTENLVALGFKSGQMKTGTPPRVDGHSLNYEAMSEQKGDEDPEHFSFDKKIYSPLTTDNQMSCFMSYSNIKVHEILRSGFDQSPLFNSIIKGNGPRYCPSIEDKIVRFSSRDRHPIFAEPEGRWTTEVYVNGFSSSLPEEIQYKALREVPGFEKVKMIIPAYAIEYDYFPSTQLFSTLETKIIKNLYFAGQVNGTTGYEEAACQGLVAGVNAHLKNNDKAPLEITRSNSYIGVLVDDLVTKENNAKEPYRMFTSRAEFRILLRNDNADRRLSKIGYDIGLLSEERYNQFLAKEKNIEELKNSLAEKLTAEEISHCLNSNETKIETLETLIKRPYVRLFDFKKNEKIAQILSPFEKEVIEEVEVEVKYAAYIEKERELVERFKKLNSIKIADDFDYDKIKNLSNEGRERLKRIRPETLGGASQIMGVSISDLTILMVYLRNL